MKKWGDYFKQPLELFAFLLFRVLADEIFLACM